MPAGGVSASVTNSARFRLNGRPSFAVWLGIGEITGAAFTLCTVIWNGCDTGADVPSDTVTTTLWTPASVAAGVPATVAGGTNASQAGSVDAPNVSGLPSGSAAVIA